MGEQFEAWMGTNKLSEMTIVFLYILFLKGKYTFKDGTVYEGYFEDDKMTNAPTYKRVSAISQEISKIKTRIPSGNVSIEELYHEIELYLHFSRNYSQYTQVEQQYRDWQNRIRSQARP